MYLAYIDETGDAGLTNSPTHYYCLNALIIHEDEWQSSFDSIKLMRGVLRKNYSIKLDEELHATEIVAGKGISYKYKLNEQQRVEIFALAIDCVGKLPKARVFSVCIRKDALLKRNFDVLEFAWKILSTRLHYTINRLNDIAGKHDKAIMIPDDTQNVEIRKLIRKLRVFNPIHTGRQVENVKLDSIIEDPKFTESEHSYFIQMCDLIAYCVVAKRINIPKFEPYDFGSLYRKLDSVLEKSVSKRNAEAVVYFPQ